MENFYADFDSLCTLLKCVRVTNVVPCGDTCLTTSLLHMLCRALQYCLTGADA